MLTHLLACKCNAGGKVCDLAYGKFMCNPILQEDEYEWFKGFADFRLLLLPHLKLGDKILIVGCGNSLLPMDLWREGFRDITSVDLSPAVIQKMATRAGAEVRPQFFLQISVVFADPTGLERYCRTLPYTHTCALGHLLVVLHLSCHLISGKQKAVNFAQGMDSLKWQVADMLDLSFEAGTFDAVIEKGTMDVLFVDNDSPWDPNPEVRSRVLTMLDETHR